MLRCQSVYSHWSPADRCCPGSCCDGCGLWCGGAMAYPERCWRRRLLWRSQRLGWGESWGHKIEEVRKTQEHSENGLLYLELTAWSEQWGIWRKPQVVLCRSPLCSVGWHLKRPNKCHGNSFQFPAGGQEAILPLAKQNQSAKYSCFRGAVFGGKS